MGGTVTLVHGGIVYIVKYGIVYIGQIHYFVYSVNLNLNRNIQYKVQAFLTKFIYSTDRNHTVYVQFSKPAD